ncbi:MAG: methyl-accepting chemotaxis protein [Lachnospiraceae bacterium]|nr:methyl-accepting chemotaxis protein [Lachnospiraceae bacterium]
MKKLGVKSLGIKKKKTSRNKSLKKRLISFTVSIILMLTVVNIVVGISMSYRGIMSNVEHDLTANAETANIAISASLDLFKNEAKAMAKSLKITQDSKIVYEVASKVVSETAQEYGFISASVVDSSGVIYSKNAEENGKSIANKDYFIKAKNGEAFISTTEVLSDGTVLMYLAAPLGQGGVLLLTMDGMKFSNIVKDIVIGETGNVFILDAEGVMIANKRPEMVNTRANYIEIAKTDSSVRAMGEVFGKMAAGETGVDYYSFGGVKRMCAYMPVSNGDGWSLGTVVPIAEMLTSVWFTAIGMVVAGILIFAFGVIISVKQAGAIAKPVANITKRMGLLAEGDLATEVVLAGTNDEIGMLTHSTAQTIDNLRVYVNHISKLLKGIADGNFDVDTEFEFKGEFVELGESIKNIVSSLNSAFSNIRQASDQVASGADQVAGGAQELSQGATEQASSIEQLSATITDISDKVTINAKDAQLAYNLSSEAGEDVQVGNSRMQEMIGAMEEISHTSGEIRKIIKTIDDIAFQTNILALNAAVEAARAGQAGKGFAVVADEVRNLASKSAEAAKSTTVLIERSVNAVENGTKIADDTAKSLEEIINKVASVNGTIGRIARASNEQAMAITQVTQGVDQISAVVQTNSATAEESAAASEELSGQASIMRELVDQFKLVGYRETLSSSSSIKKDYEVTKVQKNNSYSEEYVSNFDINNGKY